MNTTRFVQIVMILYMLGIMSTSKADLIVIGTATYSSAPDTINNQSESPTDNQYNIIWDNDSTGISHIWLDYTNGQNAPDWWGSHRDWAASLHSNLSFNMLPGYSVDWGTSSWRLPQTSTCCGGFGAVSAELEEIYYADNRDIFINLWDIWYWSDTLYGPGVIDGVPYEDGAWSFNMMTGTHGAWTFFDFAPMGLAVYDATVSSPVPEPASMLLLGTALIGIAASRKRKK